VGAAPDLPGFFRLVTRDRVASVMDEARDLARAGAPAGTLVWARSQHAGRGRRGRAWQSPVGGLYCALVLRPRCAIAEAAQVSFVAALAVAEAVEELLPSGRRVRCKWPNDVLVDGAKIAGILLESEAAGEKLRALVVGIGVNLDSRPDDVEFPATSIAEAGGGASPGQALVPLARCLEAWLGRWQGEGFERVRTAWLERAEGLGQAIRVRLAEGVLDGIFEGLDSSGALILAENDGGRRMVTAGEVFWR